MVVIVYADTADLVEKSLSCDTEHMFYVPMDLATNKQEAQESNVRATTRRSSPVQAFSYQAGDMEEINLAASVSASGAVTSILPRWREAFEAAPAGSSVISPAPRHV